MSSSVGTGTVVPMLEAVMSVVPIDKIAVHFHDTYGQSLPNILVSLQVRPLLKLSFVLETCFLGCKLPSQVCNSFA